MAPLPGNAKAPGGGGASRFGRVRQAVAARLQSVSSSLNIAGLLRGRTHASQPGPGLPGPPQFLCFTLPPLRPWVMAEALCSILFTNLFWVGLWDLVDNTVFPNDTSGQMLLLVVLGIAGLYFTDSLYDPPQDKLPQPARRGPNWGAADEFRAPGGGGGASAPGRPERIPSAMSNFYDGSFLADGDDELVPLTAGTPDDVDTWAVVDRPCVPPRFEPRRFGERVIASASAVLLWTGIWNQIDANILPTMCSYDACKTCPSYGEFPCAWYKIAFVFIGLLGQYVTRTMYSDAEVNYAPRGHVQEQCIQCGWCCDGAEGTTPRTSARPAAGLK